MAAVLPVATLLAAGLTVLPGSVREAQTNPCSTGVASSVSGSPIIDLDRELDPGHWK